MTTTHERGFHVLLSDIQQSQNALLLRASEPIQTQLVQPSRKRSHDELEDTAQLGEPITIQTHPSFPAAEAQRLIPALVLPRSCLPLTYLDPWGSQEGNSGLRLFSAHIKALEENTQNDQESNQPVVLISQSTVDDSLYAVERVQSGIYMLCKLGHWVKLSMLLRLRAPLDCMQTRKGQCQQHFNTSEDEWWRTAAVKVDLEAQDIGSNAPGLGGAYGPRLCLQRPQRRSTPQSPVTEAMPAAVVERQVVATLNYMADEPLQQPEEILNMIRSQYQEALYASMTSLAYFAKGPLSRARAAFHLHDGSAYDGSHLVQFLRSSILSLATMDIKYRETLPTLVKDLPFGTISDDEGASVIATIGKKVRKSKKIKVGKNGLYPREEISIARWWLARDFSSFASDSAATKEGATRSVLLEQRARETQLQVILVLETIALEATAGPLIEQIPTEDVAEGEDDTQKEKKKPKKAQDLDTLLDLLVDRLCIWQSMSMDEGKTSEGEDRPTSQHGLRVPSTTGNSDHLRQFYVDVLLPFYGARLPELTNLLCQKLGGPKQPSPRRPPFAKAATSFASLKPGAAIQRQQMRRPRRTLERVLTDERSASRKPPPSLLRSATDSVLPQLKREVSDTSLSAIPFNRVAMQKRYNQREVDLYTASHAAEAKLKKKVRVEQELQGAIAALKRPNPRMAVKELVEDAEKRAAKSYPRKPKNPVRNPVAQGVQVMATPSKSRQKDIFGGLPRLSRQNAAATAELEEIPPSSVSRIPLSTNKVRGSSIKEKTLCEGKRVLRSIEQTPTRGALKLLGRPTTSSATTGFAADASRPIPLAAAAETNLASFVSGPHSSCVLPSPPSNMHETPSKSRGLCQNDRVNEHSVQATPTKALSKATPSPQSLEKEASIYATLGWDDDVDELA